jgi:hypothetical protein
MLVIEETHRVPVEEDSRRLLEADAVLLAVRLGLPDIPIEVVSRRFAHRSAPRSAYSTAEARCSPTASDLVEEMRWLVEAAVWGLVSRRRVRPDDFVASPDGRYPCWMTHDFRGRFVAEVEDRLHTGFTPPEGELTTYRAWVARQARQVGLFVRREVPTYQPLRLTA